MPELDLRPTAEMAANAARGLELREKHGRGGTAVGVARARDIKNRANLSPSTVKRMHSFFSRHEGNQKGGEDDAGYIAWLLWGGDAGKAWAARKSEQIDKSESARFSHDIRLPKGKRRLNIDEAHAALAQMGYKLGTVRYDPAAGGSVYKVTKPNGSLVDMPAAKLTDFIYEKAKHMKSGTKAAFANLPDSYIRKSDYIKQLLNEIARAFKQKNHEDLKEASHDLLGFAKQLHEEARRDAADMKNHPQDWSRAGAKAAFSVSSMLDMIESQSHDQRDLAKSNLRKLAAKIADIDHTREEWDRYVRVAKSLGYSESQIAGFSRVGAKVAFNQQRQMLSRIQALLKSIKTEEGLLREGMKAGNFKQAAYDARSIGYSYQNLHKALMEYDSVAWENNPRVVGRSQNSKDGSKAKFGSPRDEMKKRLLRYTHQQLIPHWTKATGKTAQDAPQYTIEGKKKMIEDILARWHGPSSFMSRPESKAKFEKSDEYAAILMKPVTVANCGKMMKVAAEAMKYAKSVGDDDLFELAEEVGHECRATKSRASRKDAR